MKQAIIADLHSILFGTTYTSDPDSWELNKILAKGMIHHHGLYFKEKSEMPESEYMTEDVEEHFFDKMCPGRIPSRTEFEHSCNEYFDWKMWETTRFVGKTSKVLDGMIETMDKITSTYRVLATAEHKNGVTIISPASNEATKAA